MVNRQHRDPVRDLGSDVLPLSHCSLLSMVHW
jgi:hypothetical protein